MVDFSKHLEKNKPSPGRVELNVPPWEGLSELPQPQPTPAAPVKPTLLPLNTDQSKALGWITDWMEDTEERYFVVRGPAGTGKSTLMSHVVDRFPLFIPSALTNKAARVLTRAMRLGGKAKTIYSVLGLVMQTDEDAMVLKRADDKDPLPRGSAILVDEASMMNSMVMGELHDQAEEYDLKFLMVGDNYQLPPVGEETSPVWRLDCPRVTLKEIMRFKSSLVDLSIEMRARIKAKNHRIDGLFEQTDQIKPLGAGFETKMIEAFLAHKGKPEIPVKAIAWTNARVEQYNRMIRDALGFTDPFCVGDLLMAAAPITKNETFIDHYGKERTRSVIVSTIDDEFLVTNVSQGTVHLDLHHQTVRLPVWELKVAGDYNGVLQIPVDPARFAELLTETARDARAEKARGVQRTIWQKFWEAKGMVHQVRFGFSITAHRSQGSTVPTVFVDAPNIMKNRNDREAMRCLYVATSRASEMLYTRKT